MRVSPTSNKATNLIISNIIVRAHPLNLHGTQHPTHVIDNFYVGRGGLESGDIRERMAKKVSRCPYLFQLQQFGGLHQMLQLQCPFWHVMGFTPLFYPGDIVLYLHR